MKQIGTTKTMQYVAKDHLGSVMALYDTTRTLIEEFSYDAWGRRRNPTNWTFTSVPTATNTRHGFTGHEHLDKYALINMNGRVYDPVTGRFLSPDPYIQNPYNGQNFDRYAYCLNNPLKYVDPSGYLMKSQYRHNGLSGLGASRCQYNEYLDWVYGRGMYALEGPGIVNNTLRPVSTFGVLGGGWYSTSSSGMILSDNRGLNGLSPSFQNGVAGFWVRSYWFEGETVVLRGNDGYYHTFNLPVFGFRDWFLPISSNSSDDGDYQLSDNPMFAGPGHEPLIYGPNREYSSSSSWTNIKAWIQYIGDDCLDGTKNPRLRRLARNAATANPLVNVYRNTYKIALGIDPMMPVGSQTVEGDDRYTKPIISILSLGASFQVSFFVTLFTND